MTDKSSDMIVEMYSFCESVGLPTTFSDLGLGEVSEDDLMKVALIACSEKQTIHKEQVPVTTGLIIAGMKLANAKGHDRRMDR